MYIVITFRGYRSEEFLVQKVHHALNDFLEAEVADIVMPEVTKDSDLLDYEDVMEWEFDRHLYPDPDDDEEDYYLGGG